LIPISEFEFDYTFLKKKKSNLPPILRDIPKPAL